MRMRSRYPILEEDHSMSVHYTRTVSGSARHKPCEHDYLKPNWWLITKVNNH